MSHQNIKLEILKKLRDVETVYDVKIILAIEAGSRAYGLSSPDSDYDVRFIYAHRRDWYLSVALEEQRDVIELPLSGGLDINGWDLRKSLRLFWKSNPGFIEWIQSEHVYESFGSFRTQALNLLPIVYSAEGGIHHYRNMATRNQKNCTIENPNIKIYLQAMRALLSVLWLEKNQSPAPVDFTQLYSSLGLDPGLQADISALVTAKRSGTETADIRVYSRVHNFIQNQVTKKSPNPPRIKRMDVEPMLSDFFRSTLSEAWS